MPYLSKRIFLNTLACPTLSWRLENGKIKEEHSVETLFWMEQGREIGKLARELYPDGVLVSTSDTRSAASLTCELISDPTVRVIFEGTFITANYVTKVDILIRDGNSWDLVEVKSGVQIKEDHIEDMAYTTLVAQESGFKAANIFLQLINKEYRLGMPLERLFIRHNCTMEVLEKAKEFLPQLSEVDHIVHSPDEPKPKLTMNCKNCDYFDQCIGKEIEEHIFQIPKLSEKTLHELYSKGIVSILDIPDDFKLTEAQRQMVKCVKCGEVHVNPVLRENLDKVIWPAYYLDFETTQTAIPLYPDIAPYDSFPTQYSIHLCDGRGNIISHRDYLADPKRDCRRELAEHLILDLEKKGSIITYSSYERKTINALCTVFPDLEKPLQALIKRIVDLEQFVKCVSHPQFGGRTSIKVVLPALVTDLSYDGLAISNGGTAMVTFALMAQGKMGPEEMERKRAELLEYCKLDTLAMVRLHEKLHELMEK